MLHVLEHEKPGVVGDVRLRMPVGEHGDPVRITDEVDHRCTLPGDARLDGVRPRRTGTEFDRCDIGVHLREAEMRKEVRAYSSQVTTSDPRRAGTNERSPR
ncbi:hypothetical protein GCM10025883_02630 [Mobilicoccus caccae]|uniref:Uncharacterized protein n=1 Tax=Mobilicoccus caccae TaxID=1859295 RepID=A0ABQ6ILY5_9MICO|nr:hypothetical protein GCM10025883_02630 [Mobilicoccus caccae]